MPPSNITALSPRVATALYNLTQPPPVRLFVIRSKNYYSVREDVLNAYFAQFGRVLDLRLMKDPFSYRSVNCGFIMFENPNLALPSLHTIAGFSVELRSTGFRTLGDEKKFETSVIQAYDGSFRTRSFEMAVLEAMRRKEMEGGAKKIEKEGEKGGTEGGQTEGGQEALGENGPEALEPVMSTFVDAVTTPTTPVTPCTPTPTTTTTTTAATTTTTTAKKSRPLDSDSPAQVQRPQQRSQRPHYQPPPPPSPRNHAPTASPLPFTNPAVSHRAAPDSPAPQTSSTPVDELPEPSAKANPPSRHAVEEECDKTQGGGADWVVNKRAREDAGKGRGLGRDEDDSMYGGQAGGAGDAGVVTGERSGVHDIAGDEGVSHKQNKAAGQAGASAGDIAAGGQSSKVRGTIPNPKAESLTKAPQTNDGDTPAPDAAQLGAADRSSAAGDEQTQKPTSTASTTSSTASSPSQASTASAASERETGATTAAVTGTTKMTVWRKWLKKLLGQS